MRVNGKRGWSMDGEKKFWQMELFMKETFSKDLKKEKGNIYLQINAFMRETFITTKWKEKEFISE